MNTKEAAVTLIDQAREIVGGDRGYGDLDELFTVTAKFWSLWLINRYPDELKNWMGIRPSDVPKMMQYHKDARILCGGINGDNTRDNIGYGAIYGGMVCRADQVLENGWQNLIKEPSK